MGPAGPFRLLRSLSLSAVWLVLLTAECLSADVHFRGVTVGRPSVGGFGSQGINVQIDLILSDPTGRLELADLTTVGWNIYPPFDDIKVEVGDRVEVNGAYSTEKPSNWSNLGEHWVSLEDSRHFIKEITSAEDCLIEIQLEPQKECYETGEVLTVRINFLDEEDGNYMDPLSKEVSITSPLSGQQERTPLKSATGRYYFDETLDSEGIWSARAGGIIGACETVAEKDFSVLGNCGGSQPHCMLDIDTDQLCYEPGDEVAFAFETYLNGEYEDASLLEAQVSGPSGSVDLHPIWISEGFYVDFGTISSPGNRTILGTAYFSDCQATDRHGFYVENDCSGGIFRNLLCGYVPVEQSFSYCIVEGCDGVPYTVLYDLENLEPYQKICSNFGEHIRLQGATVEGSGEDLLITAVNSVQVIADCEDCEFSGSEDCSDCGDNDGDGLIDCFDPDCSEAAFCKDLYSATGGSAQGLEIEVIGAVTETEMLQRLGGDYERFATRIKVERVLTSYMPGGDSMDTCDAWNEYLNSLVAGEEIDVTYLDLNRQHNGVFWWFGCKPSPQYVPEVRYGHKVRMRGRLNGVVFNGNVSDTGLEATSIEAARSIPWHFPARVTGISVESSGFDGKWLHLTLAYAPDKLAVLPERYAVPWEHDQKQTVEFYAFDEDPQNSGIAQNDWVEAKGVFFTEPDTIGQVGTDPRSNYYLQGKVYRRTDWSNLAPSPAEPPLSITGRLKFNLQRAQVIPFDSRLYDPPDGELFSQVDVMTLHAGTRNIDQGDGTFRVEPIWPRVVFPVAKGQLFSHKVAFASEDPQVQTLEELFDLCVLLQYAHAEEGYDYHIRVVFDDYTRIGLTADVLQCLPGCIVVADVKIAFEIRCH